MRGMVVGEGGRSSGVLLYTESWKVNVVNLIIKLVIFTFEQCRPILVC